MSSECQQIRELMDSYLSEELSVETNHLVLRHLGRCQACASELTRRQRLRALLSQTLDMAVDVDRARQRIVHAVNREQRSWGRVARQFSVAAAVILGVAVAYWLSRPVDAAAYDDSAGDHVACALQIPAATTYDAERAARNLVSPFEGIADAVGLTHGSYRVIDAHMCPYKGRDYVHVVLRGNGQTLSLFAEPAVRGALPTASSTAVLTGDPLPVHATTRLGYRISAVATPEYRLYLVSERPTDPADITNEILQSAVQFIRTLEP